MDELKQKQLSNQQDRRDENCTTGVYLGGCLQNQFYYLGEEIPYSCNSEGMGVIRDGNGNSTGYIISAQGNILNSKGETTPYSLRGGQLYGPDVLPPWVIK